MARRQLQEINAGSMADIAFLLLIFFLVSTTMDTDKGIMRQLPPMPEPNTPDDQVDVKERNIFVVLVNRDDKIQAEGESMRIEDLREAAKEFIVNPANDPNLPAKEVVEVPYFGAVEITKKHVISLQNDRGTSYEMYIAVQNELVAAYNELRDELCMRKWGLKFSELDAEDDKDKIEAVETIYDRKISEAEPRNVGG